jgi:hypothetical protein
MPVSTCPLVPQTVDGGQVLLKDQLHYALSVLIRRIWIILTLMLVANCQTERDSQLPSPEFKLDL